MALRPVERGSVSIVSGPHNTHSLDQLILFGMSSLQRALRIYRDFFNGHRPHQGIGNRIPERPAAAGIPRDCADQMSDENLVVGCEQFLGGPLNSYYRKAA